MHTLYAEARLYLILSTVLVTSFLGFIYPLSYCVLTYFDTSYPALLLSTVLLINRNFCTCGSIKLRLILSEADTNDFVTDISWALSFSAAAGCGVKQQM